MSDKGSEYIRMHRNTATRKLAKTTHELLLSLSETDELTGLANRRGLLKEGFKMFHNASRDKKGLGIIKIDIKYFKAFDELFSWDEGDACLVRLSDLMTGQKSEGSLRANDIISRLGGDDFVVLIEAVNQSDVVRVIERITNDGNILHDETKDAYEKKFALKYQNDKRSVLKALRLPEDYKAEVNWNSDGLMTLRTGGMYLSNDDVNDFVKDADRLSFEKKLDGVLDELSHLSKGVESSKSVHVLVDSDFKEINV